MPITNDDSTRKKMKQNFATSTSIQPSDICSGPRYGFVCMVDEYCTTPPHLEQIDDACKAEYIRDGEQSFAHEYRLVTVPVDARHIPWSVCLSVRIGYVDEIVGDNA
jgi:hypothetical protein